MDVRSPDRFSDEVIIGWRYWYVVPVDGELALVSPVYSLFTWPAMTGAEAYCVEHQAPQVDCTCGLHAKKDLDTLIVPPSGRDLIVAVGQVSLWGNVVEHDGGWRARYAYPYSLEIRPKMWHTFEKAKRVAKRLSAVYGVETEVRFPHANRRPS